LGQIKPIFIVENNRGTTAPCIGGTRLPDCFFRGCVFALWFSFGESFSVL
jgi:hypothetical protein